MMVWLAPTATIMGPEISPVKAPSLAHPIFCAPTRMVEPLTASTAAARFVKGGQIDFHRAFGNSQRKRNFLVLATLCHQGDNLPLPRGEGHPLLRKYALQQVSLKAQRASMDIAQRRQKIIDRGVARESTAYAQLHRFERALAHHFLPPQYDLASSGRPYRTQVREADSRYQVNQQHIRPAGSQVVEGAR